MPITIKKKMYGQKQQTETEIVSMMNKASEFLSPYKKKITIAAAVVAAVALIFAAYSLFQSARDKKASALVSAAYDYYNPAAGVPPDYKKALDLFRDIAKNYPGTTSGAVARYYAGNSLVSLGRTDEALKEYQDFIKRYSGDKFLLGLVHQRMGYVYLSLGNQGEAVKSFEQAEKLLGPGASTVELARLYERAGDTLDAQKKYKEISQRLIGTAWADEAMSKVQPAALPVQPANGKEGK